ncbi:unnamed protein product [Heligmosomoides polygyrus]|uniref:Peptidase M12A domain-containing protein n=1 Tax=Heligmosomoides polygyrus TaxID=6339 RepID=A0A183GCE6_HELPZ|nr:unnamed protein product [Heligmosomoides polygyrus]
MKVIESNSGVEVNYCRNHLGHLPTVENFRMHKNSVDYIVRLLKDGFAPSQIICKIRSEFGSGNPRSRLFCTATKDIRKISEKNGIVPGRLHNNDFVSVVTRVARNSHEDGIQYYQGYKEEDEDGFVMERQFNFPPEDGNNVCYAGDVNNNEAAFIAGYPEVDVGNEENVEKMTRILCFRIKALALEIGRKPEGCDILDDIVVNMKEIYGNLSARTGQRVQAAIGIKDGWPY